MGLHYHNSESVFIPMDLPLFRIVSTSSSFTFLKTKTLIIKSEFYKRSNYTIGWVKVHINKSWRAKRGLVGAWCASCFNENQTLFENIRYVTIITVKNAN